MEKRQLSDSEKQTVLKIHGRICFVNGHSISGDEEVQFHHIMPFSEDGPSSIDNIAPVCKEHHKHIGTLSLHEYRDRLGLEIFFQSANERRLDDVLREKIIDFGKPISYSLNAEETQIKIRFSSTEIEKVFPLYKCPATKTKFFYALIPVMNLKNDSELQPRPLELKRVWELYRHLLTNTQLAASVCRIVGTSILLFDGQHKAASQVWLGRSFIECKVYIEPDERKLRETNLTAHEKLRQMPFYTSTLMRKYSDVFGDDWQEYLDSPGDKSEKKFVQFLSNYKGKSKAEATKEIRMALINDILKCNEPPNKISEFIAEENRSRKNPLTYNILQRTFFNEFLLSPPIDVDFESEEDFRRNEKLNMLRLLNIIAEETLIDRWNPEIANALHRKTARIYIAGSIRAWVPLLKDVIAQLLHLFESDEKEKIFFREISEADFETIRGRVKRLFSHKIWLDPDTDVDVQLKINDPSVTRKFLKEKGLDASWVLGVTES